MHVSLCKCWIVVRVSYLVEENIFQAMIMFTEYIIYFGKITFVLGYGIQLAVFNILLEQTLKEFRRVFLISAEHRALHSKISVIFWLNTFNGYLFKLFRISLLNRNLIYEYISAFKSDNLMSWRQEDMFSIVNKVHEMSTRRYHLRVLNDIQLRFG